MASLIIEKLSGRTLEFTWQDLMHETLVKVHLPELSLDQAEIWGDWGPMYDFKLKASQKVVVSYDGDPSELEQGALKIQSPILAKERRLHPFTLKIQDPIKGLLFHFFLDEDYSVGKVEIQRIQDRVKLFVSDQGSRESTSAMAM